MKKIMLILIMIGVFILPWMLTAPPYNAFVIIASDPIKPYEQIWDATCQYESNNNPFAIGDKHLRHKSYGIAQIRKSRLDDYYRQTGIRYTVKDMFDPVKAKKVFMFYAHGSDMEVIAREWNGGPNGMKKKSTIKYWNQIKLKL